MLVNQSALEREQAQVETTIVALPGQQTFAGDKLAELTPDRVKLIQQALPVVEVIGGFPMTVRFAVPEGFAVKMVTAEGAKIAWRTESDGRVLAVEVTADKTADVAVRLAF